VILLRGSEWGSEGNRLQGYSTRSMFNTTSFGCSDLRVEGTNSNKGKKREKKIKQWKLRKETVRRKFEENVRIE